MNHRGEKKMDLVSIASGSSGNCIYVGSENTSLLVDVGISGKKIEQGLKSIEKEASKIDGILVTHEHLDHISGLGVMARRYKLPIFSTAETIDAILNTKNLGKLDKSLFHSIKKDSPFYIGDLKVEASATWHDAVDPVCYTFFHNQTKAAIATDMGDYDEYLIDKLRDSDILFLEANHDVHMLEVGPYPYQLKKRILGKRGHLSNERAGQLLSDLMNDHLKNIFLGHLSKENNYEQLAYETVKLELFMRNKSIENTNINLQVAKKDAPSRMVSVLS